ncbi:transposase [Wukongibacter sp. M2B1]|uniref:transposase n=1 Tax=Wukongibacter sp. M2B1 TaxID=3088895 RepID=UPI003D79855B
MFKVKNEKEEYLKIIRRYKLGYEFEMYSYCIMDNHTRLFIEVENISLNKIMK